MAKIKISYEKSTDANLLVDATSIVNKCSGNEHFTTIQLTIDEVAAATTAYGSALDASKSGEKTAIARKDAKKQALIILLRKLGDLVSAVSMGDRVILVGSGFQLYKDREPASALPKPAPPMVRAGANAGEIVVEGRQEKGVVAFTHLCSVDPAAADALWRSVTTTSRRFVFSNLVSGQKYYFKQGLVGTREQYVESETSSYIAQ